MALAGGMAPYPAPDGAIGFDDLAPILGIYGGFDVSDPDPAPAGVLAGATMELGGDAVPALAPSSKVARLSGVDRGDTVPCVATFFDEDDLPVDPASVTFEVLDPRGQSSEVAYPFDGTNDVTHPVVGVYALPLVVNRSGWWSVRCVGATGGRSEVVRGNIRVRWDRFLSAP